MDDVEPNRKGNGAAVLWAAAAVVAALGTWVMYDALPGINWGIWTAVAAAGLLIFIRPPLAAAPTVIAAAVLAVVIAAGAAITALEFMQFLICLSVILFLAMQMLLSANPSLSRITAVFTIAAPILAFSNAVIHAVRRGSEASNLIGSVRARAALRGLAITFPVVIAFALLLSEADPVFASWRDAIMNLVADWDFVPRTIFFLALLTIVLGAYGYAARETEATRETRPAPRWLGATERLILLGSIAGLFWLFLAFQLSYLFGNLPLDTGSGVTFAEYARRGFGELTVVASASALLIIISERYGDENGRERLLQGLTFAILVAVLFLLGSAFHRVLLYEEAYGFTTARLYAQAYMIVVAVGLIALATEVAGELEPGRLFRRTAAAAILALVSLIYWNHEAWIARRNIDRFAVTGKLDTVYLTRELSPNAVPAIIDRLAMLPEPQRSELRGAIDLRYSGRHMLLKQRWFEWNLGRARARDALQKLGVNLERRPEPLTR